MPDPAQLLTELELLRARVSHLEQIEAEYKQTIEALSEAEERYLTLLEALPTAVLVLCEDRCIFANTAAAHAIGYNSSQDMIGMSTAALMNQPKGISILTQEIELLCPGGSVAVMEANSIPLNLDGKPAILITGQAKTERWRRDMEMQRSEWQFGKIFRASPLAISIARLDNNTLLDVNEAYLRFMGYSREEIIGKSLLQFGIMADADHRSQIVEMLKTTGTVRDFETQLVTRSGEIKAVLINSELIDLDGVQCSLTQIYDITGRKQAEDAEREQRAFAEALQDISAVINSTLDLGEVLERILGSINRVVPHRMANVMLIENSIARIVCASGYPESLSDFYRTLCIPVNFLPTLRAMQATGKPYLLQDSHETPEWMETCPPEVTWIRSYVAAPIYQGDRIVGVMNLDSDTPNTFTQVHAERLETFAHQAAIAIRNARLYEDERRGRILAQIFQKAAEGLSVLGDLEHTFQLTLEQLKTILDFDEAAIYLVEGEQLHLVALYISSNLDQSNGIIQKNSLDYVEIPLLYHSLSLGEPQVLVDIQQDDEWQTIPGVGSNTRSWIGMPLVITDVVIGFLSICSDQPGVFTAHDLDTATRFAQQIGLAIENSNLQKRLESSLLDLREAQAHLARTARLSVAGEIAAGVAHQINNPLTTVIAQSYLLMRRIPSDDPAAQAVETIRQAAYRAGTVVQRLLDFARPSRYTFRALNVNQSLEYAVSLVRPQIEIHTVSLNLDLAPNLPSILASEQHLEDVWINLLLNARDAVTERDNSLISLSTRLCGEDMVEVVIEDNGCGIAPENIEHIFTPFYTTKKQGTGLGLPICYDIVTRHGGGMVVTSEPNIRTRFTITLPVVKD